MYRTILFPSDRSPSVQGLSKEHMISSLKNNKALLWVNLEYPTVDESKSILNDIFRFHPLAIEDCEGNGYQNPKVDDYGTYLFIIAHALGTDPDTTEIFPHELNLFLGPNYLVTCHHTNDLGSIQRVWDRMERDELLHQHGSDFLCHAVLDEMIDDYFPLLDNIDNEIDQIETILL